MISPLSCRDNLEERALKARKLTESRKGHDARRLRPLRELVCTAQILQQPRPNNGLCQQQIPNQPGPPPPEPALQQLRLQYVSSACILSFIILKPPHLKRNHSPSLTLTPLSQVTQELIPG